MVVVVVVYINKKASIFSVSCKNFIALQYDNILSYTFFKLLFNSLIDWVLFYLEIVQVHYWTEQISIFILEYVLFITIYQHSEKVRAKPNVGFKLREHVTRPLYLHVKQLRQSNDVLVSCLLLKKRYLLSGSSNPTMIRSVSLSRKLYPHCILNSITGEISVHQTKQF